jgi:hypothetical protein
MHGVLVGAVLGMGVLAFLGAMRTRRNWLTSRERPPAVVMWTQVALQVALGAACIMFGTWFLLFGE